MDWTALATLLSKIAESRAAGQVQQGNLDAQNNQTATSRYQALVNAGRLSGIEQPAANARQTQIGSLMSSFQPVSVTHPRATIPTITGGPQMTPEMRQMGSELTRSALLRQMGGNQLNTGTFPSDSDLGMTGTKPNGTLDTLIGGAPTVASILSLLLGKKPAAGAAGAGGLVSGAPTTELLAPQTPGTGLSVGGGGSTGAGSAGPGVPGFKNLMNLSTLGSFGLGPTDRNDPYIEDTNASRQDQARNRRLQRRGW
jgi:hypothetical protein